MVEPDSELVKEKNFQNEMISWECILPQNMGLGMCGTPHPRKVVGGKISLGKGQWSAMTGYGGAPSKSVLSF